jgi:XRE family transcriptional regulator, regulator of sulfur utilization
MPDKPAPGRLRRRFAEHVVSARTERGWTQEKLAEKAGLARTYISEIERLKRNATLDSVERIADALGIDAERLLTP